MQQFNILSRRAFLDRGFKLSMGVALSTLVDLPFVVKRALAEDGLGLNGKKLLFIFLRGANDGLNTVVPVQDPNYYTSRPTSGIGIAKDTANNINYADQGACFDPTQWSLNGSGILVNRAAADSTYSYDKAIDLGNGFAALHPSLKFLAPVYNAGDLAFIHRVAYPKQSRSHFDSQDYWENGSPNNKVLKDGIFYRAMLETGLTSRSPLTGVSVQSALPLILRGSAAAMTNLSDASRYNLFGIPNTSLGNAKADSYFGVGNTLPAVAKQNRELLDLQFKNLSDTLQIFAQIPFNENYYDDTATDNDLPYNLFPTANSQNGGYAAHASNANKYVMDTGSSAYTFMKNLKSAAMILNKTDAIVAGTELGGFDTHNNQGGVTGSQSNLLRRIGWGLYALRKYFLNHADRCNWNDVVVVTLSEFGRTSVQNGSAGTDHAEAGVMMVAGGAVQGYSNVNKLTANSSGVFGCSTNEFSGVNANLNWLPNARSTNAATCGTLWAANPTVTQGYLRRQTDYRSVLGEILRKHLGATPEQLRRIIAGYANAGESLASGGTSTVDGVKIRGEVGVLV